MIKKISGFSFFIKSLFFQMEKKLSLKRENFYSIGKGVVIDNNVQINRPDRVILKDNIAIHSGTIIDSRGGVIINRNTGIGYNCIISTVEHNFENSKKIPFDNSIILNPVKIDEFVWIGMNVIIFPGVEIGEGAILSMGAVITEDVPPLAIVAGNPAQIISYRSQDHYYRLKQNNAYQNICVEEYKEIIQPFLRRRKDKVCQMLGL